MNLKNLAAAFLLAANCNAHPAVEAAFQALNGVQPGNCFLMTHSAIQSGAVGYVRLAGSQSWYDSEDQRYGVGHIAPLIRDGQGRLQLLMDNVTTSYGTWGTSQGVRSIQRVNVPPEVEAGGKSAIGAWALDLFNGANHRYISARVGLGTEQNPEAPGPRWMCTAQRLKDLGYRVTMSKSARDSRVKTALEDCSDAGSWW